MKKNPAQLVVKYPDAPDSALNCLRSLLKHYTGKLVTKTEVAELDDEDKDDDDLELNAEPETTTTAELTLNLTPAALAYIVQNILEQKAFDTVLSKNGVPTFEEIVKGA